MIIRGIHIENWRCIGRLDLKDLPTGVIVLHGPNRTGKSSLLRALRCCLYDFGHDATNQKITSAAPWNTAHSPHIAVEFETGGRRYRVIKRFSRKKDGFASLECWDGTRWVKEVDEAKEAHRRTRELLGAESSSSGLNQLLWLDQGEIRLPEHRELDAKLENKLLSVLGVLVTGGDQDFKEKLDQRYGHWFTSTGGYKKTSTVTKLDAQRAERQKLFEDVEQKFRQMQQVIRDLERSQDELLAGQEAWEQAKNELKEITAEREQTRERRQQFRDAERAYEDTEKALKEAAQHLQRLQEARDRWQKLQKAIDGAEKARQLAQGGHDRLAAEHRQKVEKLEEAKREEQQHQEVRAKLEECRQLLNVTERLKQLGLTLENLHNLEAEIGALEEKIRATPAPIKKQLDELRENRRQAAELKAQLAAAALVLTVAVERPTAVRLRLDGQPAQELDLPGQRKRAWSLRQQAELEIPGLGVISISRGREQLELEHSARKLADLDRAFNDTVLTYQGKPEEADCLDRLAELRLLREGWVERRKKAQHELNQLVPQGRAVAEREREELQHRRKVILERRPELANWRPSAEAIQRREAEFQPRTEALEKSRIQREREESLSARALRDAENRLQSDNNLLIEAKASAKAAKEELDRQGDEEALKKELEEANTALELARARLQAALLTEAEKTVEERYQRTESAVKQCEGRLRELENQLNILRGQLQGSEGLHPRRTDTEAALRDVEQQIEREKFEAEAHRHLRELFESCRESQVQQVMSPISGRVLEWAKCLGLDEYRELRFGDRFLPDGIAFDHTSAEECLPLSEESTGTEEQLSLLVRLAIGGVLSQNEPAVAILDDPLTHADPVKLQRMLEIIDRAAQGDPSLQPPAGPLQIIILTCVPVRFQHLLNAARFDLASLIKRK